MHNSATIFLFFSLLGHSLIGRSAAPRLPPLPFAPEVGINNCVIKAVVR